MDTVATCLKISANVIVLFQISVGMWKWKNF